MLMEVKNPVELGNVLTSLICCDLEVDKLKDVVVSLTSDEDLFQCRHT